MALEDNIFNQKWVKVGAEGFVINRVSISARVSISVVILIDLNGKLPLYDFK